MTLKEHKVIDAEIIGQPKKKIPLKKDSLTLNILLIAVLVFLIGGAGFAIGRYTAPPPTVKIKKHPDRKEYFEKRRKLDYKLVEIFLDQERVAADFMANYTKKYM